jgi:hypothetical protein
VAAQQAAAIAQLTALVEQLRLQARSTCRACVCVCARLTRGFV